MLLTNPSVHLGEGGQSSILVGKNCRGSSCSLIDDAFCHTAASASISITCKRVAEEASKGDVALQSSPFAGHELPLSKSTHSLQMCLIVGKSPRCTSWHCHQLFYEDTNKYRFFSRPSHTQVSLAVVSINGFYSSLSTIASKISSNAHPSEMKGYAAQCNKLCT